MNQQEELSKRAAQVTEIVVTQSVYATAAVVQQAMYLTIQKVIEEAHKAKSLEEFVATLERTTAARFAPRADEPTLAEGVK